MGDFINFLGNNLADFWTYTGFANATVGHVVMILVGLVFIYLAIAKEFEPMLLIPIGFGILIGNIPFNMDAGLKVGIYEEGSVLNGPAMLPIYFFTLIGAYKYGFKVGMLTAVLSQIGRASCRERV